MNNSILIMLSITTFIVSTISSTIFGDPLPYQPIAISWPDTADQQKRDSATVKIGRVRVNQAGYRPADEKHFYYIGTGASDFKVVNASTGAVTAQGTLTNTGKTCESSITVRASNNAQLVTGGDTKYTINGVEVSGTVFEGTIPDVPEGEYKIVVGSDESTKFVVNTNTYGWVHDALLKFFGVNRCGDGDSWFHGKCHVLDGPNGDGSLTGGWHDCGDHIKESQTMSYTMAILALAASALQDRDTDKYGRNHNNTVNVDGIPDALCELRHGADFVRRSYKQAGGNTNAMITSVGNFGYDHNWWGRPEAQDKMSLERGGPVREVRRELWASVAGRFAGAMAIFSRLYKNYDAAYAAEALQIAKALYVHGKNNQKTGSTPAYNGENSWYDDMGFAAIALLWATHDTTYKYELLYDTAIGPNGNTSFPKGTFAGGWFAQGNASPQHGLANTCWASMETPALWALYKLILKSESEATACGIGKDERLNLIEDAIYAIIVNIGDAGKGDVSITLPQHSLGWKSNTLKYDGLWKSMHTQMEWVWNRYQAGNITELFCYYDIAKDIQGMVLPNTPGSTDWKAKEVKNVLVQQLDYMCGVNPWDVSMIYGVGDKNFNHPHHRASTPEGKNVPGAFYKYRPPAGALQGSYDPAAAGTYKEHYDDYRHSETGIDAAANILLPVMGMAKEGAAQQRFVWVRILYVDHQSAIIEIHKSFWGKDEIRYGVAPSASQFSAKTDSGCVLQRFTLSGLQKATTYFFDVKVTDALGLDTIVMDSENGVSKYFSFTTLDNGPGDAIITTVKVCRVTHDSVEIFWYTPNGKFNSIVYYGETKPPTQKHEGDISGIPTSFHYVKIGGLKERTTYYFYVQSGTTIDDNNGKYYTFTTTVEHVKFDIRALQYDWGGKTAVGINFVNQDIKSYDSLEMRLYIRGTEAEIADFAARVDIGIKYNSAGFQDTAFKQVVDGPLQKKKPVKMDDTYDTAAGTWAWYLPVPIGSTVMESGARFRLDLLFVKRNLPFNEDLLDMSPTHKVGPKDWSWAEHHPPKDPVDYKGMPIGIKDDVDNNYWNTEVNQYITVYRKNQFVWGYSPSKKEQLNKINYYEIISQITSPLNNPNEMSIEITANTPVINVKGWAQVTEDGVIEEIWVNGKKLTNISSMIVYNPSTKLWNFSIPVSLSGINNVIDIIFFAGPPNNPTDSCFGCASSNHHFSVKFTGSQASTMTLKAPNGTLIPDTVSIDTTRFHVWLYDKSGDKDPAKPEKLSVTVVNPIQNDNILLELLETGNSTDTFTNATAVAIVDKPPAQTGNFEIAMKSGDSIIVHYQDPTDSTDSQTRILYSRVPIPVPSYGWYKDINGDGSVDQAVVQYPAKLDTALSPDSIQLHFPAATDSRFTGSSAFTVNNALLNVAIAPPFAEKTTSFTGAASGKAISFTTFNTKLYKTEFTLYDSIGAVLKSAALVERVSSPSDSLHIYLSEPFNAASIKGATLQLLKRGTTDTVILEVTSYSVNANAAFITVVPTAGTTQRPQEGDSLRLVPGPASACVIDQSKNAPHKNNPPVVIGFISVPPIITSAWYEDKNADGIIDTATIRFNKKIAASSITNMTFTCEGASYSVPASTANQVNDTTITINLKGAVVSDSAIRTSGAMTLSMKYQTDTLSTVTLADKAAPVIVSATYIAKQLTEKKRALSDTLKIVFSEKVTDIASTTPFVLNQHNPAEQQYYLLVGSSTNNTSQYTFQVKDISGVTYPLEGDSIWINSNEHVSDIGSIEQSDIKNRRVRLKIIYSIDYTLIIRAVPNPFIIGISDIPAPILQAGATRGASDFKKGIAIEIKTDPLALMTSNKISLDASVHIIDAVGNIIIQSKGMSDTQKDIVLIKHPKTGKLYFLWNGKNKNRRLIGKGVYSAIIKVIDKNNNKQYTKTIMIGAKQEML